MLLVGFMFLSMHCLRPAARRFDDTDCEIFFAEGVVDWEAGGS
jgi:hypothetical protein